MQGLHSIVQYLHLPIFLLKKYLLQMLRKLYREINTFYKDTLVFIIVASLADVLYGPSPRK